MRSRDNKIRLQAGMIFEQEQWSAEHYQYYSTETEFHLHPHRLRSESWCCWECPTSPTVVPGWGERQHKVETATPAASGGPAGGGSTLSAWTSYQDRKILIQFNILGWARSSMQFWVSWCWTVKYKDEMGVKWADDILNKFSQSTWCGEGLSTVRRATVLVAATQ